MQPRRMHRPPNCLAPSTKAVLSPSPAAARAAAKPALPPPITATSKSNCVFTSLISRDSDSPRELMQVPCIKEGRRKLVFALDAIRLRDDRSQGAKGSIGCQIE